MGGLWPGRLAIMCHRTRLWLHKILPESWHLLPESLHLAVIVTSCRLHSPAQRLSGQVCLKNQQVDYWFTRVTLDLWCFNFFYTLLGGVNTTITIAMWLTSNGRGGGVAIVDTPTCFVAAHGRIWPHIPAQTPSSSPCATWQQARARMSFVTSSWSQNAPMTLYSAQRWNCYWMWMAVLEILVLDANYDIGNASVECEWWRWKYWW